MIPLSPAVVEAIEKLRSRRAALFRVAQAVMNADHPKLYVLDLLAIATLNRALCLLKGYAELVGQQNMICAAPLLRCQLDNVLRFSASMLVERPHDFAAEILRGAAIKDLKDRDGKRMTDSYLVTQVSKEYPWVAAVYKSASGYVHLSEKHIVNTITPGSADGSMDIKVTEQDGPGWTEHLYLEAIEAFGAITDLVVEIMDAWALTKSRAANGN